MSSPWLPLPFQIRASWCVSPCRGQPGTICCFQRAPADVSEGPTAGHMKVGGHNTMAGAIPFLVN